MRFLKWLFGKKEKEASPLIINFEELDGWIERGFRKDEEYNTGGSIAEEILQIRSRVEDILQEIDEVRFNEEIEKRIYKPVKTSKPIYIKGMRDAVKKIEVRKPLNFDNLKKLHRDMMAALKIIQKMQLGQGRYMTVVFREQALKLGTELNRLIDLTDELGETLERKNNAYGSLREVSSKRIELESRVKALAEAEEAKSGLERDIKRFEKEEEGLAKDVDAFRQNKDFQKFEALQKKSEEIEKDRGDIETMILNQLGPFKRILKKFHKVLADGDFIADVPLSFVAGLIDDPVHTYLSGRRSTFEKILEGIELSIKEEKLGLKEREGKKAIAKIDELSRWASMDLREKYEKLQLEGAKIKKKIAEMGAERKLKELEGRVEETKREIRELRERLKNTVEEIAKIKEQVPRLKEQLEARLSELEGREVEIRLKT